MNEIQKKESLLSTGVFNATRTGLEIIGEPTFDEWYEFGGKLAGMDRFPQI